MCNIWENPSSSGGIAFGDFHPALRPDRGEARPGPSEPQLIALLGRSRLLAASMLMAGGGLIVMPFMTSAAVLVAIMVVVGLGLGLGQPMTIT